MDFGKLPTVDHVNFELPASPAANRQALEKPGIAEPHLYLGATGYHMKPWVGHWYPAGAKEKDFLRYYGQQFNTIEHNTTHYRIPDADTVRHWRNETPADFRFCPKIPQTISHARDLGRFGSDLPLFCEMMAGLEEKLGCCFMQLPPGFSPRDLRALEYFTEKFPAEIPLAIEVRHPAFFTGQAGAEAYFQLLAEKNIATVITDVAGRRDVCHMRLTSRMVLIRFVGNGLHPSDYTRIQQWGEVLATWFSQGLATACFFAHEPDNLLAPELAVYCTRIFSEMMPHIPLRGPQPVAGRQGDLFG